MKGYRKKCDIFVLNKSVFCLEAVHKMLFFCILTKYIHVTRLIIFKPLSKINALISYVTYIFTTIRFDVIVIQHTATTTYFLSHSHHNNT